MKKLELKYLDDEINNLQISKKYDELTEFGKKKLTSFIEIRKQLSIYGVSESYIKCWNCKQFEQTGTNTMGNEVGICKLNECKVSHPKWQKCGEYEQCGNFR